METTSLADQAFASYERAVSSIPGMRRRPGQVAMARHIADALAPVTFGDSQQPHASFCVIDAGTGVGKSLGYTAVSAAIAQAKSRRVVISTATVALGEQLARDLPFIAKSMERPFRFGLAKGRGRYVCKLRLDRLIATGSADDVDLVDEQPALGQSCSGVQGVTLYKDLAKMLRAGTWNGDRDALSEQPDPLAWSSIAADRHTCTGKACPQYKECSFVLARKELAGCDVILANHDLLLASLGTKVLPELEDTVWIIDEAHRLAEIAIAAFAQEMDLTRLKWLTKLAPAIIEVAARLGYKPDADVARVCRELRAALSDTGRLLMDGLASFLTKDGTYRFPRGTLPDFLYEPLSVVKAHAGVLVETMQGMSSTLRDAMRESPGNAASHAEMYARLGAFAARVESIAGAADLLLDDSPQLAAARWFAAEHQGGQVSLFLRASPFTPADQLAEKLWSKTRAVVLTSATMKTCGSFSYFLSEVGLARNPAVSTLSAESPFDYAAQGRFVVVDTAADPKQAQAFNAELAREMSHDMALVTAGGLALFTSRAQMTEVLQMLPEDIRKDVLVQGSLSRPELLRRHRERVEAGRRSILAGLAMFGTGLDLPRKLCEHVLIAKLPFAPPHDPVGEARTEWLVDMGRDPFGELVVPETCIKLLQWSGRAIRSEDDRATVVCYDRRLIRSGYGQRILQALPAYAFFTRRRGEEKPLQVLRRK